MKSPKKDSTPFLGSVKVGPKGQIVIPKEVRDMFGIEPGDSLIMLAHSKKGIAIERPSLFSTIADAVFAGKTAKNELSDEDEKPDDTAEFSQKLKQVLSNLEDGEEK